MFDVVTIGETMLRLTPDGFSRWEQAERLQIHVGGSESNTAVGLARLGLNVCWLSRLTDNDFGRRIERTILAQGVDTQFIQWTNDDRVGVYFYEEGSSPRESRVLYDRAGSAFTRFSPMELPKQLFSKGNSKCLHVTGISLALGDTVREMIFKAITLARDAGWSISFDVNYRSKLWSIEEALAICSPVIQEADILFIPIRDAIAMWQYPDSSSPRDLLSLLTEKRQGKLTVMSMGAKGAAAQFGSDFYEELIVPVTPIGRLGGGDAFSAGFLYGYLSESNVERALRWATACATVKYSIPGDLPLFHKREIETIVNRSVQKKDFR